MKESILPIYAQAVDELNLQTYDRGLYGKALCDANGEESLARVYYIRARVAHIIRTNKGLEAETVSKQIKVSHAVTDPNVSRVRVRRRRSSNSEEDSTDIAKDPAKSSMFRVRRSYDSMVNLFARWTAL
jgi:hypothetical protein